LLPALFWIEQFLHRWKAIIMTANTVTIPKKVFIEGIEAFFVVSQLQFISLF